jgi:hypothetical protein
MKLCLGISNLRAAGWASVVLFSVGCGEETPGTAATGGQGNTNSGGNLTSTGGSSGGNTPNVTGGANPSSGGTRPGMGGSASGGANSAGSAGTSTTSGGSAGNANSGGIAGTPTTGGSNAGSSSSGGNAGNATDGGAGTAGKGGNASTGGNAGAATGGSAGKASTGGAGGGTTCQSGLTACGMACVNTMTSADHCGACNAACTGGRTCMNGACLCSTGSCAALPAFPGADGAAGTISGGRAGAVYHVTKVDTDFNDMVEGTLRYGLSQTGKRTIVFDVSGVFQMGRAAVSGWNANGNGWDTASRLNIPADVTLAGQTAPGPVIIAGGTVKPGGTNIIVRNIVFAPGYGNRSFNEPEKTPMAGNFPDSYVYDALDISGQNVMIDHVTTVYATDETISMNELANNITIQYCNISQGQNYPQADAEASGVKYTGHALGSLFQAGSNAKISILHNLYAHQKGRLPRVGTESDALTVAGVGAYNDFRNNVFYNWMGTAGTGASGQFAQNNFINNFYLAGPGGDDPVGGESTALTTTAGGTSIFNGSDSTNIKVFQSGNVKDINKDSDPNDGTALTNADFGSSSFQSSAYAQTPYTGVIDTAAAALTRVLDYAGASWWKRSIVDTRLISEVRTGTGKIMAWADDPFNSNASEGSEWRALMSTPVTSRPAGFDTDKDGMPDAWETAHGLKPDMADNNGDFDSDGYTNLEEYLNELAAWPAGATAMFNGASNHRYAEIRNWNLGASPSNTGARASALWQPSRFDNAQVRAGEAVVDAVGQHASTLQIAASIGGATLSVVDGWLELEETLDVGAYSTFSASGATRLRAGRGEIRQTGGTLFAKRAVVLGGPSGARGSYHLAGGFLRTPLLGKRRGDASFEFSGGRLEAGVVAFDLSVNGGVLAPGEGVGHTHIAGNLALNDGALELELDGLLCDTLGVTGKARLGGALRVLLAPGFQPKAGDFWTFLVADGGLKGRFLNQPADYEVELIENRAVLRFGVPPRPLASFENNEPTCSASDTSG